MPSPQVVSDFDMTLSRYCIDGKRGDTSHGMALAFGYDFRLIQLANRYFTINYSSTLNLNFLVIVTASSGMLNS